MPAPRRRFSLIVKAALGLGVALVASGCAEDAPLDIFQGDGSQSQIINDLQKPVFLVALIVGFLVMAAIVFIVVKFRAKDGDDDELPTQTHGVLGLELGWTILPAVILAFVAVGTVVTIFDLTDEPEDAMRIDVYGQQWWWGFEYDTDQDGATDITTATEMIIPVGTPVVVDIRSRDVIHSFWIPALNGKKDAVPGRTHSITIEADEPGIYRGQCTEYCGLSHARMQMRVVALAQEDYDAWVENQLRDAEEPTSELAQAGLELFQGQCATCHQINGVDDVPAGAAAQVSGAAPNLTHLMTRSTYAGGIFDLYDQANDGSPNYDLGGIPYNDLPEQGTFDRNQLEAWLRNPPEEKPMAPDPTQYSSLGRGMPNLNLSEEQIDQLVAYLETLK